MPIEPLAGMRKLIDWSHDIRPDRPVGRDSNFIASLRIDHQGLPNASILCRPTVDDQNRRASQKHARHADAEFGVDEDEFASGDGAAVGGDFDGLAAVAVEGEDVAGLEVGQAAYGEVDSAEFDRQGARGRRGAGWVVPEVG